MSTTAGNVQFFDIHDKVSFIEDKHKFFTNTSKKNIIVHNTLITDAVRYPRFSMILEV